MAAFEEPDPAFRRESELLTALMGAAIAHELIQPLSALANYVKAAQRFLSGNPSSIQIQNARGAMEKAAEQTVRAGTIIRYLKDFVEKQEPEKTCEDVNHVIRGALTYGQAGRGHRNIQIGFDLAAHLPPVLIDRVQIQQLLLYLIKNIVDGVADSERVEISISSSLGPGQVEIQMRNNMGFSRQGHLLRAFAAPERGGLGIGLKICQSILDAQGGSIRISDEGRLFAIRLPPR
jgi:two-component system, LuxR family, sensor kinase FixL